jgi:hypothetical protein
MGAEPPPTEARSATAFATDGGRELYDATYLFLSMGRVEFPLAAARRRRRIGPWQPTTGVRCGHPDPYHSCNSKKELAMVGRRPFNHSIRAISAI